MTLKKFILELITDQNDKISSKRFLAIFIFTPVFIITLFLQFEINVLILLSSFIATLLGITGLEKFGKNFKKNR